MAKLGQFRKRYLFNSKLIWIHFVFNLEKFVQFFISTSGHTDGELDWREYLINNGYA